MFRMHFREARWQEKHRQIGQEIFSGSLAKTVWVTWYLPNPLRLGTMGITHSKGVNAAPYSLYGRI